MFEVGQLVVHPKKPEWGPGKIVRTKGPHVEVVFREVADRRAKKFPAAMLELAEEQDDVRLDHLPELVEDRGKLVLPKDRVTVEQARSAFLRHFPLAFRDPGYIGTAVEGERTYKWLAHARYVDTLGEGRGLEMLRRGAIPELASLLPTVLGLAHNLLALTEWIAFREGLENEKAAAAYFETLFALVDSGPTEDAFEAHALATASLPAKGSTHTNKWTIVTLLPFIARPDVFMFVKPTITQKAANALGFEIGYDPSPNWKTYARILKMCDVYGQQLQDWEPRDFIDLQSFFWVTGDTYEELVAKDRAKG